MTGSNAHRLYPANIARINHLMHVFFFQAGNTSKFNIFKKYAATMPGMHTHNPLQPWSVKGSRRDEKPIYLYRMKKLL